MRIERKRIFIKDLPEVVTENEIKEAFQDYGNVMSVEIKTRKEPDTRHTSLHFCYVNLETDDDTLRQCFKDFANKKWQNQYIMLQLARESFLDRLKREREPKNDCNTPETAVFQNKPVNGYQSSEKKILFSSEKNYIESEKQIEIDVEKDATGLNFEPNVDIVIKNNRGKILDQNGLKIPSFGNDPIARMEKTKKNVGSESEANLKRLQSLKKLKSQYQGKKSLIKAALSNVDLKPKNKIIFDEANSEEKGLKLEKNRSLFYESEDENFEADFSFKEQFQGYEGQQLLQLQSKYKNDKRFTLDSRFLTNNKELMSHDHEAPNNGDMTLQEEKKKEYEILNEILGKNITPKSASGVESIKKTMLRFDPSQQEHTKFVVQKSVKNEIRKKKESKLLEDKKVEEKEAQSVSKEVFYKVTGDLKECLQENTGFSLLNLFGKPEERPLDDEYDKTAVTAVPNEMEGRNPFRYDSSSDDDEADDKTGGTPEKESKNSDRENGSITSRNLGKSFYTESFFFKNDDYRLQEGSDFMERMRTNDLGEDFCKMRRNIKGIVKAKIKNNQRKNRPFKHKLGGNKRKKFIRMKKAMKR